MAPDMFVKVNRVARPAVKKWAEGDHNANRGNSYTADYSKRSCRVRLRTIDAGPIDGYTNCRRSYQIVQRG